MLFSDSVTAVTKIVLRSQWGWWGGVKKLFKWINSPSHSAFSILLLLCLWRSKCGYPSLVSQVYFSLFCMGSRTWVDMAWNCLASSERWPCCIQRHLLVRRYSHMLCCSPGSGVFSCQRFHPHPLLLSHTISPGYCVVYHFSHPHR